MNKNSDPANVAPIRLPRQTMLPTVADVARMASEAARARRRIELFWQPEGRPDPVVLTVRSGESGGKTIWTLSNHHRTDSIVIWSGEDVFVDRVVAAMRDWLAYARATEGWCVDPNTPYSHDVPAPENGLDRAENSSSVKGSARILPLSESGNQPMAQPACSTGSQPPALPPHWAQHTAPASNAAFQQLAASSAVSEQEPLSPEQFARLAQAKSEDVRTAPLLLGELLVAAGFIGAPTLNAALTLQNASINPAARKKVGDILVEFGAVHRSILEAAIQLQDSARKGFIHPSLITEHLLKLQSQQLLANMSGSQKIQPPPLVVADELESTQTVEDVCFSDVLKNPHLQGVDGPSCIRQAMELLRQSEILKTADLDDCSKNGTGSFETAKAVLSRGLVDLITFKASIDCSRLMRDSRIRREQAIIALLYCHRGRVSLRDAIMDMDWPVVVDDI